MITFMLRTRPKDSKIIGMRLVRTSINVCKDIVDGDVLLIILKMIAEKIIVEAKLLVYYFSIFP